ATWSGLSPERLVERALADLQASPSRPADPAHAAVAFLAAGDAGRAFSLEQGLALALSGDLEGGPPPLEPPPGPRARLLAGKLAFDLQRYAVALERWEGLDVPREYASDRRRARRLVAASR